MIRMSMPQLLTLGAIALLAAAAHAENDPEDVIKYRQNVMKANGAHAAAAAAIVQGKVGYKKDLADHAKALAAINHDTAALFPKGSDFGDTKALDSVWSKRADFEKRSKDAQIKSAAFAKTVAAGDTKNYAPKLKELVDSCKACHKDYRKEDK